MNALSGPFSVEGFSPVDEAAAAADPRHGFLRAAWFAGAARTLVARGAGGSAIAALPIARRGPLREVPGSYWPCRSFPIAQSAEDAEIASFLSANRKSLGLAWRLGPLREDDPTALRLQRVAAAGGWTLLRRRLGTCFVLDLAAARAAGPWPRPATQRKNRWHERRLAEHGELGFQSFRGSAWTPELFDTLAGIERESWVARKTDGRDCKFLAPAHRAHWERAASDPLLAGMMCVHLLTIGGAPAAFTFAIEAGPRLSFVANGYDARFARHSPGRILLYRELQRAFEAGIDEIDWGLGDAGYKTEMGASSGPAMLDLLLVRPRLLAAALKLWWERKTGEG